MKKLLWTLSLVAYAILAQASMSEPSPGANHPEGIEYAANMDGLSEYEFALIKSRILTMESIVNVKFTSEVESYLRAYLTYGRKDSERLLAQSQIYFPIIEYHLELYGMPEDLKYLPVIESRLTPYALSTAGAAGLWQLRTSLGQNYGLEVNNYLDERRDPYKSTQVALKYLHELYKRFGTWELALAAYNAGPTKVSQAIREAGTRDFWKLREHLPRETFNFIPRFIAASYVLQYHQYHNIYPSAVDADMLDSRPVTVYHRMTFKEIVDVTGARYNTVKKLNPVFIRHVVPENPHGNYVSLPQDAAKRLSMFVNHKCATAPYASHVEKQYMVKNGDSLSRIAHLFGVNVDDIRKWNDIKNNLIYVNQVLKIKVPVNGPRA